MKNERFTRGLGLFALAFCYAAAYTGPGIRTILYDATREAMQVSNVELSALTTIAAVTGFLTEWFGGPLADKYSVKKIMVISMLAKGPLCIISAMFPSVRLVQCLVWMGFNLTGGFAFWPAMLKAVRLTGGKNQNMTWGVFEAAQGGITMLINFVALFVFARFSTASSGYTGAMTTMGIFCIIAALVVLYCYNEKIITDDTITENETGEKKGVSREELLSLFKLPGLWLCSFAVAAAYSLYICQTYLTPYFTDVLGVTVIFSGLLATFRDSGMKLIAGPVGGVVATRLNSACKLQVICMSGCIVLIACMLFLSPGSPNVVLIAAVISLLLAFFQLQAKATMWSIMDEAHIPIYMTGTAVAVASYIAQNIPDAFMPLMSGYILDSFAENLVTGYSVYFAVLIGIAAVGLICSACIVRLNRRRRYGAQKS